MAEKKTKKKKEDKKEVEPVVVLKAYTRYIEGKKVVVKAATLEEAEAEFSKV